MRFELYLLAVLASYFCYCWMRIGQTVGMFAWRLLLSNLDGKRANLGTALLRFLIATVLGFGTLGLLWALFNIDRVALQDRLNRTRVLRLPKTVRAQVGASNEAMATSNRKSAVLRCGQTCAESKNARHFTKLIV